MPFFLIAMSLILITLNIWSLKKEKKSFEHILHNKENNLEDFQILIGELRVEFSETILELQKEIVALNNKIQVLENTTISEKAKITEESSENINEEVRFLLKNSDKAINEEANVKSISEENSEKVHRVCTLFEEGFSVEDICEQLSIGKGEVLLIKELYKK